MRPVCLRLVAWIALCIALGTAACRSPRPPAAKPASVLAAEEADLAAALRALAPAVLPGESDQAARLIVATVEEARVAHRLDGGAVRRNLAVNLGWHEWGLCWHWTELLGTRLRREPWRSFELHWGCAHAGSTWREHNAVVLTARGQPFRDGLVIDPWRRGGHLTWIRVADDRYPWRPEPWSEARWRGVENRRVPGSRRQ